MKTCRLCGIEQPDDGFRPERRVCRRCEGQQHKAWLAANSEHTHQYSAQYEDEHVAERHERNATYYAAHVEAMRERARQYAEEHPEERRAAKRRQYHANPERWAERQRAWLAANPDKAERIRAKTNERRARWEKEHPDRARDKCARRRAKTCGAAVFVPVDRAAIWMRDSGRCHICGKACDPNKWHLDHLIPLSLGGTHESTNVAVAHPFCNMARGNRGPAQLRLGVEV